MNRPRSNVFDHENEHDGDRFPEGPNQHYEGGASFAGFEFFLSGEAFGVRRIPPLSLVGSYQIFGAFPRLTSC